MIDGLVSIMMPAYNAESFIGQAIDSVLSQSFTNWELVIVNDGSKDSTVDVVSNYTDPRIRLISQENGGEASARNTALDNVNGEFLAFLDADDQFLPDHLELTIKGMRAHEDWDGIYSDGYYCDQSGKLLQTLSSNRRGPFEGWLFDQLVRASDVFGPPTCIVLRRHPIIANNFRYDTRIVIGPDWDFNTRYSENTKFGNIPQATCLYRVHTTNITLLTNRQKRVESLAICREKAIKSASFSRCSPETQYYALFDLLYNILKDNPEKQDDVVNWEPFRALPERDRAKLLRLMASQAIADGGIRDFPGKWLRESRRLNPNDATSLLLSGLYRLSPGVCKSFLEFRQLFLKKPDQSTPFGNLA